MTLPVEKLVQLNNTLKNYSLEERARLYNLKPDRADVITNAADIFLLVAICNTTKPRKNKSPSPFINKYR